MVYISVISEITRSHTVNNSICVTLPSQRTLEGNIGLSTSVIRLVYMAAGEEGGGENKYEKQLCA